MGERRAETAPGGSTDIKKMASEGGDEFISACLHFPCHLGSPGSPSRDSRGTENQLLAIDLRMHLYGPRETRCQLPSSFAASSSFEDTQQSGPDRVHGMRRPLLMSWTFEQPDHDDSNQMIHLWKARSNGHDPSDGRRLSHSPFGKLDPQKCGVPLGNGHGRAGSRLGFRSLQSQRLDPVTRPIQLGMLCARLGESQG